MPTLAQEYAHQFPVKGSYIYFNHAGVCPLPERSARAAQEVLERQLRSGAARYPIWSQGIRATRQNLARLLGAAPDEIAFVKNTTQGLIIAAESIPWREGDNVVTSAIEFPANVYPWLALERRGVETRFVGAREGRVQIDDLAAAMDSRTRVLTLSWVQFTSGYRSDLGQLSALCRDNNSYLVVDAIQGLGALELDLSRYAVDFLCADGHKWLLSVEGCGVLYVRRQILDDLVPCNVGWLSVEGAHDFLDYHLKLRPDAARFEEGSHNVAGIHALGASAGLLLEAGPARVEQEIIELTDYLVEESERIGCTVTSPREEGGKSGIVAFKHPSLESAELADRLRERNIVCVERAGAVRFSPHFYNDREEVDRALAEIKALL